jgi:hypothetical protein
VRQHVRKEEAKKGGAKGDKEQEGEREILEWVEEEAMRALFFRPRRPIARN